MSEALPPNLPPLPARRPKGRNGTTIALVSVAALPVVTLIVLRLFGLLIPYSIPTGSMSPAINARDNVLMEGLTYLKMDPRRGDIVVFTLDERKTGRPLIYMKRLVGLPGERLRIFDGVLYVNDQPITLRNKAGDIHYVTMPTSRYLRNDVDSVTIPEGHYFLLGDNSEHSSDSRFWGFVPAKSVMGRLVLCYWPPDRIGSVR